MTSLASPNCLPTSHHWYHLHLDKAPMNRAPFLSTPTAKPFPSCAICLNVPLPSPSPFKLSCLIYALPMVPIFPQNIFQNGTDPPKGWKTDFHSPNTPRHGNYRFTSFLPIYVICILFLLIYIFVQSTIFSCLLVLAQYLAQNKSFREQCHQLPHMKKD